MKKHFLFFLSYFLLLTTFLSAQPLTTIESKSAKDKRMDWWRDARFGMFIHWGLYAVPAGEWKGTSNHAEWIRTTAQIPLKEYDKFLAQFNPVKFNADEWVRMAQDAGMKYIVITSKHHDGFALWDSKVSDFDVMSTPFKRDILKELATACQKDDVDVKLCFYYSIMDWHHPDYNQRREWEMDRPTEGTEKKRYIAYMKAQLKELLTNYGEIGVLWFDGEWEDFWTHGDGKDLYNYVRSLQPNIIINNRVDKGRRGMQGMTSEGDFAGDFGTPEQEIPETGLPGVDWESCMTMNDNWGYNKHDKNFKSTQDLIRKLVDISSKGGNFLLNIGPKADGTFPGESVQRLKEIGEWMKRNGKSIYGTKASPFENIGWGRVTQLNINQKDSRLYLHVFDWPKNGILQLDGLDNTIISTGLLHNSQMLTYKKKDNTLSINVPAVPPDPINTVISVPIVGKPVVYQKPVISSFADIFINTIQVAISLPGDTDGLTIRYTTDGSEPTLLSQTYKTPLTITATTIVKARTFKGMSPVSETTEKRFEKVEPLSAMDLFKADPGLRAIYYEGEWDKLPDFLQLQPKEEEIVTVISPGKYKNKEKFGVVHEGYINVEEPTVFNFYLSSDDGSRLYIDGNAVIDHDGLHGMTEKKATVALAAGFHSIRVLFFEKTGGDDLNLSIESSKIRKIPVPAKMLFH